MRVTDFGADLDDLASATERYEVAKRAMEAVHEEVVAKALSLLKRGAEPGDVYERIPFTSTYMRTLARDAGIPGGRPGIKPAMKTKRMPPQRPKRHAAHDDSSPT